LLFFSSEQYGLLSSSYERGNRESVFSSDCSAGTSSLPLVNTSLRSGSAIYLHHNRLIIAKSGMAVNEKTFTKDEFIPIFFCFLFHFPVFFA